MCMTTAFFTFVWNRGMHTPTHTFGIGSRQYAPVNNYWNSEK